MYYLENIATLEGHAHPIYALSSSQKQHILFSGGGEGAIVEWSLRDLKFIKLMFKTGASIYSILCPSEFPILISGDRAGQISIFNFEEQKLVFQKKLSEKAIFGMQNLNENLYFISEDGFLRVLNLLSLELQSEHFISEFPLRSISLNKENKMIYIGGKDHKIHHFNIEENRVTHTEEEHTLPVFSLVYDEKRKQLISGSRDAQIKIWTKENTINIPAHMFAVNDLILTEGNHLISASMDKTIKVWDLETMKLIAIADVNKSGHHKSVNSLAFTPYNNYIISAGDDRLIKVWQLKSSV